MIATLVGVAVLLVVVLALHHSTTSGPALAKTCTTPAIALSTSSTGDGTGIRYSITGPKTGTYVIAVDAAAVTVNGSSADVTPKKAFAVAIHNGLSSCTAHSTLPALASGPHDVELFRDGTLVAKAPLH